LRKKELYQRSKSTIAAATIFSVKNDAHRQTEKYQLSVKNRESDNEKKEKL